MLPIRLFRRTILNRPSSQPFRSRFPKPRSPPRHQLSTLPPRSSQSPQPPHNPAPKLASPAPAPTLSQRMRTLSREYGWSALGVYLALTAIDFPFCFLAVRALGTERIGAWEHAAVAWVQRAVPIQVPDEWKSWWAELRGKKETKESEQEAWDHGVDKADEKNSGETASIWTQLALAYAIHKSFIFIRVPVTAAITPRVVKILRGWGWNIGKRRPLEVREAAKAAEQAKAKHP